MLAGEQAFRDDWMAHYAAEAILMHVGESALRKRLAPFREEHPFPGEPRGWRIIRDTGNFYDHQYHDVDLGKTWSILSVDMPRVAAFIRSVVAA